MVVALPLLPFGVVGLFLGRTRRARSPRQPGMPGWCRERIDSVHRLAADLTIGVVWQEGDD